jgi:hypothetical protein
MGGELQLNQPADKADGDVGIDFIDILFALVVGQALVVLTRALKIPAPGLAHLAFATILTVTSWIGYHRSGHRYTGQITFDVRKASNLIPLAKFTLDILLVVLYWVAVQSTEWGFSSKGQSPSWRWTTIIAASVFGIYVLWDLLAWRGEGSNRGAWANSRRIVSVVFFIITLIVLVVAALWAPRGNPGVTAINVTLILVTIAYRVAKDTFTAGTPATAGSPPDP